VYHRQKHTHALTANVLTEGDSEMKNFSFLHFYSNPPGIPLRRST